MPEFLWSIMVKKGVKRGIIAGVAALAGLIVAKAGVLSTLGIVNMDPTVCGLPTEGVLVLQIKLEVLAAVLTGAAVSALEMGRNYAKNKKGVKWL